MTRKGFLAVLVLAALVGCMGRGDGGQELHTIKIRVHPDEAVVSVRNPQRVVVAVVSQPGPTALFDLPEGRYAYTVTAADHQPFEGSFEIPDNKNLEVWLQPR